MALLVRFVNRTKSGTALIETALTGESLYFQNFAKNKVFIMKISHKLCTGIPRLVRFQLVRFSI